MSSRFDSPLPEISRSSLVRSNAQLQHELQLSDIIMILRRRKLTIFACMFIGLISSAIATIIAERDYISTTTIEINKESGRSMGLDDLSGIGSELGGADSLNIDLQTQQAVIQNDSTLLTVIEGLHLTNVPPYATPPLKSDKENEAKKELELEKDLPLALAPLRRERVVNLVRSRLHVALVKGTRLIAVSYTDTDPQRAAQVANAIVDAYINEYTQARYLASTKASGWLGDQLTDLKRKVTDSQKKVTDYQRQSGLVGMELSGGGDRSKSSIASSTSVPLERLMELNRDLTNAEASRIGKEAIYRMTQTQDPDVVLGLGSSSLASSGNDKSVLSPGSTDLNILQQLRQQKAQLKVQLAGSAVKYGARNPIIAELRTRDAALDGEIANEIQRIHQLAKNELELAKTEEAGIQQSVLAQEQDVSKLSSSAAQLLLLQEEATSSRQLYEDLYTKLEEANVAAGVKASNITVVDGARATAVPASPRKLRFLEIGLAAGLVLGLLAAFIRDSIDDTLVTPDQIQQFTAMSVLGLIPSFNAKSLGALYGVYSKTWSKPKVAPIEPEKNSQAWLLRAPRSSIAEAYRSVRTALLMSRADHPPRVVIVTSPEPGDGKTTTCFNTAAAFALQGDRVLLMDTDMRRPNIHRLTDLPNLVGLSNCLTGSVSVSGAIQQYAQIANLSIMTAGVIPPMPAELLGSKRFADLLNELKTEYDFIFIDSPPMLMVTDAVLVSSLVEEIVLVVRSGKTTRSVLRRSLALLNTSNLPLLGTLLNDADLSSADYAGYGYDYGKDEYYAERN